VIKILIDEASIKPNPRAGATSKHVSTGKSVEVFVTEMVNAGNAQFYEHHTLGKQ